MKLMRWLDLQKEGIFIGVAIALLIYYFNIFPNLLQILPTEPIYRIGILIYIGSSLGAIIDSIIKPKK